MAAPEAAKETTTTPSKRPMQQVFHSIVFRFARNATLVAVQSRAFTKPNAL
jgi:hypothetical protein